MKKVADKYHNPSIVQFEIVCEKGMSASWGDSEFDGGGNNGEMEEGGEI